MADITPLHCKQTDLGGRPDSGSQGPFSSLRIWTCCHHHAVKGTFQGHIGMAMITEGATDGIRAPCSWIVLAQGQSEEAYRM